MKSKIKSAMFVTIVAICSAVNLSYAQFNPFPFNTGVATIPNNQVVGIGNFPGLNAVRAVLHVNSNLTAPSTAFPAVNAGEVFRTDCPNPNSTFWRMLRGGTPYGYLFNSAGSNDFQIQSPSGFLLLNATNGNVGIGITTPQSILHLGSGIGFGIPVYEQFTNASTGAGATNGLKVGISSTGVAQIIQQQSLDMRFYTNGNANERMRILGNNGFVGIGTTTPSQRLEVNNDINLTQSSLNHGYRIADAIILHRAGNENICVGQGAGSSIAFTYGNVFVGYNAGSSATSNMVFENTFVGRLAGTNTANAGGSHNAFFGDQSGMANIDGGVNTFLGAHSGAGNLDGNGNVFVGFNAGTTNTTGSYNTILGYNANVSTSSLENAVAIGSGAIVNSKYKMILGNNDVNVGIGLSNDVILNGPQNKLEINYSVTGDYSASNTGGGTGFSGLRFRDLTTLSHPYTTNPSTGVLSVDDNGDVILVPEAGDVSACGSELDNFVTKWSPASTKTVCNTIIYDDGAGHVGISTTGPVNKLDVVGDISTINSGGNYYSYKLNNKEWMWSTDLTAVFLGYKAGEYFRLNPTTTAPSKNTFIGNQSGMACSTGTNNTFIGAEAGIATTSGSANVFIGDGSQANTTGSGNVIIGTNAGILNTAGNKNTFVGTEAGWYNKTSEGNSCLGYHSGPSVDGDNNTMLGSGTDCNPAGGVSFATAVGAGTSVNTSNTVAIGRSSDQVVVAGNTPQTGFALTVNGDAYKSTGGTAWSTVSDLTVKKDTSSFTDGISIIRRVHPIKFNYKNMLGLDSIKQQIGVAAQQIINIAPYTIDTSYVHLDSASNATSPLLTFNSNGIFWAAINAIKQLDSANTALATQVNHLVEIINSCCQNSQSRTTENNTTSIDVNLSSKKIVLNQNVPNPFKEQTTNSYDIPKNTNNVIIIFTDMSGDVLKEVPITEKGKGSLNVYAADLSNGIYTYSIVADGITIDSKKMVCSK